MADLTPPPPKTLPRWSQVWHLPVLVVGMALLAGGLYLAKPRFVPPDYPAMLDTVQQYLRAGNTQEAGLRLNLMNDEGMALQPDPVRGRYYQYLGDHDWLVYTDLYPVPVTTKESTAQLRKVIDAYATAEDDFDRDLDGQAMQRWARALMHLNREADALAVVDRMHSSDADKRYQIIRQLIEEYRGQGDPEAFARLLDRFERSLRDEKDKRKQTQQRQWVANVRARHYVEVDDPQRAIDYINREMQRLRAAGAADSPQLLVLLARAYQAVADFDNATRLYGVAQQMVSDSHKLNGPILVGLAQIELAVGGEGFEERAHVLFSRAAREHPMGEAYIDALIGRAHVEAMMRRLNDAVDHFRLAIAQLLDNTPAWDPRREEVTAKIASHVDRAIDLEEYEDALDYLSLLLPMYDRGRALPARLLLQFAQIHEQIAGQRKAHADALDPLTWAGPGDPPLAARRSAYQESAQHFGHSAQYFKRHADAVTVIDDESHGQSLWSAGANFDNAQRWGEAIDIYAEFVSSRPGDDGQQLKARHHLGQAYMADRQYQSAIGIFNDLIDQNPQSNWAYESLVPLARCYAATQQADAAVRVLLGIVDGHPGIRPESETYRQALIDLARTYYQQGQQDPVYFVSAIERLDTAVERYGHTPQGPVLRYMLADSLRRSSRALTEQAENARSERQRLAFQAERAERLRTAEMYYDQVITELEARFAAARSELENLYLRNAYFYKADCSYDRRDFALAIDRYREAAQRWSQHPASLVAQVQIVNAYCEMQEFQQAYVANQNALWQLSQMPDEVFDRPDMPMTRQHWEDWLRWSSELKLLDKQSASVQ